MTPERPSNAPRGRRTSAFSLTLGVAAALSCVGAAPGIAAAGSLPAAGVQHGTILSIDRSADRIQLVTPAHLVVASEYTGAMPSVKFGSRIRYRVQSGVLQLVGAAGHAARSVVFDAEVTSVSGHTVELRLGDGSVLGVRPRGGQHVASLESVLVTETNTGRFRLTRRHGGSAAGSSGAGAGSASSGSAGSGSSGTGSGGTGSGSGVGAGSGSPAKGGTSAGAPAAPVPVGTAGTDSGVSGTVSAVGDQSLTLITSAGSSLTVSMPSDAAQYLGDNEICDTVNIQYFPTSAGPVLNQLIPTGISASPAIPADSTGDTCASESEGGADTVGTITQLSATSVTVNVPGSGDQTFPIDPSSGAGTGDAPGDVVDVTYLPSQNDTAVAIGYVEMYSTGKVTAVNKNLLSMTDAITGASDSFSPDDASFNDVANSGDTVGVVYYIAGGIGQADDVADLTAGDS